RDIAVVGELLAPFAEQHDVRGSGHLHALRDEPGETELGRLVRVGMEVAAPGVGPRQLGRQQQGAPAGGHCSQNVAVDVHSGSPSGRATTASTTAYSRPRFSYRPTTVPVPVSSVPASPRRWETSRCEVWSRGRVATVRNSRIARLAATGGYRAPRRRVGWSTPADAQ